MYLYNGCNNCNNRNCCMEGCEKYDLPPVSSLIDQWTNDKYRCLRLRKVLKLNKYPRQNCKKKKPVLIKR